MTDVAKPVPEGGRGVLRLFAAGIAMVLLIYAAILCAAIEFLFRHLIAAPAARLLSRLGRPGRR